MNPNNLNLDPEEQDILDSYENGEWTALPTSEFSQYQEYAKAHVAAGRYVSVAVQDDDFISLQHRAEALGVSIQALASEILHLSLQNKGNLQK